MSKFVTTVEYIENHNAIKGLAGQPVKILCESDTMSIDFFQKITAWGIQPEFVKVNKENEDFSIGYILGRLLQSNQQVVVLTDKPFVCPDVLSHSKTYITDDLNKIVGELDLHIAKRDRAGQALAEKAGITSSTDVSSNEVKIETVKRGPGRPSTKVSPDVEEIIGKILVDRGVKDILDANGRDFKEAIKFIVYAAKMSFEVVSFEVQLSTKFQDKALAKEIHSKLKPVYDQLKQAIEKA